MSKKNGKGTIKELMDFFGYKSSVEFMRDWKGLTHDDKEQLKQGMADGSMTY